MRKIEIEYIPSHEEDIPIKIIEVIGKDLQESLKNEKKH